MREVTLCAVQSGPCGRDRARNLQAALALTERAIRRHAPSVVVLSELATTPYFCPVSDPAWFALAEPVPGPSTRQFGDLARTHRVHIVLPLFERAPSGTYYNSAAVIGPDGRPVPGRLSDGTTMPCYRKTHIPATLQDTGRVRSNEKYYFAPGPGLPIFHTAVGRLGILICYDKRFTEAWRALTLQGAEVIINPNATFGHGLSDATVAEEARVLALYNQAVVVAAWKAGREVVDGVTREFTGGAHICAPDGRVLAAASTGAGRSTAARVDLDEVHRIRQRKPLARDRRPELYRLLTTPEPKPSPQARTSPRVARRGPSPTSAGGSHAARSIPQ